LQITEAKKFYYIEQKMERKNVKGYLHWWGWLAETLVIFWHNHVNPAYLGHLGQDGPNRSNPICVVSPKVSEFGSGGTNTMQYHWQWNSGLWKM